LLIYLDTSSFATIYNESEEFHSEMKEATEIILKNQPQDLFVSSEWSLIEFGVAMKKVGLTIDKTLERLVDARGIVQIEPIQSSWIIKALDYVFGLNLHSADAHHLAVAKLLGCEILVSCDEDLLKSKVRKEFNALSPKEFLEFLKRREENSNQI